MIESGVDSYVTLAEAEDYITGHNIAADERPKMWAELGDADKEACLRRAAMAIDSLPLPGVKCVPGQAMAFPRCHTIDYNTGSGAVPAAIKIAQIEEAFELAVPGEDSAAHAMIVSNVKAKSYDRYSVTYATPDTGAEVLDARIVSYAARGLLRPFLGGGFCVC